MKKLKYIIMILIISILISPYINIVYADNSSEYSEIWDINRDGKIDEIEQQYKNQGIPIMMPELDKDGNSWVDEDELRDAKDDTGKSNAVAANLHYIRERKSNESRYEGYEYEPKESIVATFREGTNLYFSSREKPEFSFKYTVKNPVRVNDFEKYINNIVKTDFDSFVYPWQKFYFYKIPIEEFFKSYEGTTEDIKDSHGQSYNEMILKNKKTVFIEIDNIGTDVTDDMDKKGAILRRFTLSVPDAIIEAEQIIYELEGLPDNAFISTYETYNLYETVVDLIEKLNEIASQNLSTSSEHKEKDIEKCGYSGYRVNQDQKDLAVIEEKIRTILVNRGVASYDYGKLKLHSIKDPDTGEIIADEKVTEKVDIEEGKSNSDSKDEILEKDKYYGPMREPKREDYVKNSSYQGLMLIFSSGQDFLEDNDARPTDGLMSFSNTLYSILFVAGIAITVLAGLVIGIKFILGSVEEKAEIKKYLWPYLIGCIVIYGGLTIWKVVLTILQKI